MRIKEIQDEIIRMIREIKNIKFLNYIYFFVKAKYDKVKRAD